MALTKLNLELPTFGEIRTQERERKASATRSAALRQQRLVRSYQAAAANRLTGDWSTAQRSANADLRSSLRSLRARSRVLAHDNDYIKKFLGMVRTNIVGPQGVKLQCRAETPRGKLVEPLNRKIEKAWADWSHPETASASGKLSWIDQQRLFVTSLARDGEVLVRKVFADNAFGFGLKFIDVGYLDETYNEQLPNGNRVLMSVEVNASGRPVAYHLTPPSYDYLYPEHLDLRRVRVPANEIIHAFLVHDDEEQSRGVPWAHTAMLRLKILGGYEEAELVAARIGACKMGFVIPPADDEETYEGEEDAYPEAAFSDHAEPGMWQELPPGYTIQDYDPQHPNTGYDGFQKTVLRGIAAGLDVTYFTLANDLSAVNYSSARIGLIEERDIWRALQSFVIEHFCRPVFQAWLESAIITGVLGLRATDYAQLRDAIVWRPRGWAWVDPEKDLKAKILALDNLLTTYSDTVAEEGEDFADILSMRKKERDMMKEAGLAPVVKGAPTPEGTDAATKPDKEDSE
ncbi:MAG: phage portal protein [Pyrinomonadaceae bacterium MAG19_C2-C3]|nr:phage portal protein [Pyrinomonadaceae bacterium MAG19_C2-C3]